MGLKQQAREFFAKPFNKRLFVAVALLGIVLLALEYAQPQQQTPAWNATEPTVHFFFLPTCPHCNEQKPFNAKLQAEFPEAKWVYHDVSNPEEGALLAKMAAQYGLDTAHLGVPATFFRSEAVVGFDKEETTGVKLRAALQKCIAECTTGTATQVAQEKEKAPSEIDLPFFGRISLADYSLPALAVVLGIVDGFNPCAMWVLAYLIALVMELNDKRRIWLIVGTFVLASGVLYFLFMTAWLNAFLALGFFRPVTIIVGLFALGAGALGLKEWWETRKAAALVCKVGDADDKAKTMNRVKELVSSPLTIATFFGIVALAFAVNSIEFVCSSAIPAVFTQVLALAQLEWWQHYAYIALYDFFFMLDDLIIFGLAAFAVTRYGVGEKYAKQCKLIGGAIMLVLGVLMLFAPQLLR